MSSPRRETIEREKDKLFLTDAELLRRLGIPEKIGRKMLKELSQDSTFPAKEAMAGNRRYWPAVSHWFDKRGHARAKPAAIRELENRPVIIGSVYFLANETHIKIGFTTKAVPERVVSNSPKPLSGPGANGRDHLSPDVPGKDHP